MRFASCFPNSIASYLGLSVPPYPEPVPFAYATQGTPPKHAAAPSSCSASLHPEPFASWPYPWPLSLASSVRSAKRTDAKLASALSQLVQQYRWLCQEIEWLKCRVVGADSSPIDSLCWKAWKCRQASKRHLDADRSLLSELSDDPHFQRLVKLHARLRDVQHEMRGYEASYLANQAFIDEVIFSFPSLKRRLGPSYSEIEFDQILWAGETVDPQAFFAAVFVRTLQSFEYL